MAETQQPTIWGLGIAFTIIAIAAVVLRFQARRIKAQKLEIDDWTILAALTTYALELLTWPAVGMTKISVLLMYRLSCTPIASQWNFNLEFTCMNQEALFTTALATDVATDFLVLSLPMYKVWKLQIPTIRKIFIIGIFLLGGLVYTVLDDFPEADTTWIYAPVFYWTIIETNVGVLSACLPTLRPLQEQFLRNHPFTRLRKSFTHLFSLSNGKRSSSKTGDVRLDSMEEEMLLIGKNIPAGGDYSV
ncbi:hypothetical protein OCU04_004282 [Sclerotinia nivalis]|uniref:Rhodopsin domain-containing protein n=1 Tax=Sclerotinia nivalis TaxID=352851 RepID=A0A9X0AQ46_9HELO|nr:hypothetical protein OCU04_004282 [Sclerotinia nivalis]